MTDDAELLRRYAQERSQGAFAELVQRHLGLVYHAALRQCGGDTHRAEDVAQTVFTDLARKAAELSRRPVLAGWLYTSTRYAAASAVRTEVRRQAREQEAHAMSETPGAADLGADWAQLRPVIDDALHELGESDREAVLLRFFEGRPFAEIGARLAVSEDAARMRVERALEKLRGLLARRGVTSTAALLGTALATQAGAAVPAGLAASITGAVLGSGVAAATVATFMSITKLQAAAALAVIAAGTAGLIVQHQTNQQQAADIASLRAENGRLAKSAAELDGLRADHAEVVRLRGELAALRSATPAPAPAPAAKPEPAATDIPLAAGLAAVESLGDTGRATPRAAWSTQLWAARSGDLALEAAAITVTPESRAKLEALRASLPEDMRTQYDSPEKLLAFALLANPHPVGGMSVLAENQTGPDDVTLQTEWQHADDTIVHHSEVQLHHEADGWKTVMPASIVDRAIAYLSRR